MTRADLFFTYHRRALKTPAVGHFCGGIFYAVSDAMILVDECFDNLTNARLGHEANGDGQCYKLKN